MLVWHDMTDDCHNWLKSVFISPNLSLPKDFEEQTSFEKISNRTYALSQDVFSTRLPHRELGMWSTASALAAIWSNQITCQTSGGAVGTGRTSGLNTFTRTAHMLEQKDRTGVKQFILKSTMALSMMVVQRYITDSACEGFLRVLWLPPKHIQG